MSDAQEKSGALPGAQEKYLATLTAEGRYIVNDNINLDPIPSYRVSVRDQAALDAALNAPPVPGPPSIVDRIIAGRVRDELASDEAAAEIVRRHQATIERNKALRVFGKGELLTADEICIRLGISSAEFEVVVSKTSLYVLLDNNDVLRYPSASANKIARITAKRGT